MCTMLFLVHVWRKVTSSSHLAEGAMVKSLEEEKFLHNMVFWYRYYRKVPQGLPEQRTWVMSRDRKNCYFMGGSKAG